jgi:hypothetical protein
MFCMACGCSTDLYAEGQAESAAAAIVEKAGHKAPRAFMIKVTPKQLTMRLENPEKPGTLQQWWYFEGEARGPKPVKLLGEGSIEPGLVPLDSIDFKIIAKMAEDARKLWKFDTIQFMELRTRLHHVKNELEREWLIHGKKDGKAKPVSASMKGEVAVPQHLLVKRHVGNGKWFEALALCDYFAVKHNPPLKTACEQVYAPAFAKLKQAGQTTKISKYCRRATKVGEALIDACAQHKP